QPRHPTPGWRGFSLPERTSHGRPTQRHPRRHPPPRTQRTPTRHTDRPESAARHHRREGEGGRHQFTTLIPTELTISNNRTAQVWKRKKVKDGIQAITRAAAADRYPVGKANIYVGIHKRTTGAYDPVNLVDTFKGMVDEL